jgi:hypothetical protein
MLKASSRTFIERKESPEEDLGKSPLKSRNQQR